MINMSTSRQQAEAIAFKETGIAPETARHTTQNLQHEQRLQLLSVLHGSLDLQTILKEFQQAVETTVPNVNLYYQHEELQLHINIGSIEGNQITYTLDLENQYLGTISFIRDKAFADIDIQHFKDLLCLLLHPVKNAIEHYHALQSALRDPLTQLANRAALEPALHRDIELARRHGTPFSILALDLDHFKHVNDNYGHHAGDYVLQWFSKQLEHAVRDSDLTFRIGGEEFLILLSNTDEKGAITLAERIRENIENKICYYKDTSINTTVSIGIANFGSEDDEFSLMEAADKALYRAKQNGRNRVE